MAWLHKRSIAANATVTINFDASYTGTESGTIAIAHKVVISGILTALNTSTNNFIVEINNSAIGSPTHVRAAVQRSPVHIVAE